MENIMEYDGEIFNEVEDEGITEDETSEEYDVSSYLVTEVKESDKKLAELIKAAESISETELTSPQPVNAVVPINTNTSLATKQLPPLEYGGMANLDNDFELARSNMIQLTKAGNAVVEDLVALAKSSEHPNAYKTLTETLTAIAQLNKDLLELYDRKSTIENKNKKGSNNTTTGEGTNIQHNTQNNVFVGTTDELLDMIAKKGLLTLDGDPVQNVGEEE